MRGDTIGVRDLVCPVGGRVHHRHGIPKPPTVGGHGEVLTGVRGPGHEPALAEPPLGLGRRRKVVVGFGRAQTASASSRRSHTSKGPATWMPADVSRYARCSAEVGST